MGDIYIEHMIKKKFEAKDALFCVGLVVAGLAVMYLGLYLGMLIGFPMLSLLITAGVCFGVYKLTSMRLLEYEYSLTNGFVTVDKIINRSSRKRITSFELDTCEDIGLYTEHAERLKTRSFDSRVFASRTRDGQGAWFLIARGKKTGKTLLVFEPSDEMLEAIKKFIPRQLRFEKFGRK